MYTNITTERLRIRPISITDAKFMINLVNSDGWLKFIGNRNILTIHDAEKYICNILENNNFYYNVFELKANRKAIGIITFLKRDDEQYPDIGFAITPQYEKNGYTLEASKAYLNKLKESNAYNNIIAITLPNNLSSKKLLTKLGLIYTGDFKKAEEVLSYYTLKKNS